MGHEAGKKARCKTSLLSYRIAIAALSVGEPHGSDGRSGPNDGDSSSGNDITAVSAAMGRRRLRFHGSFAFNGAAIISEGKAKG